MRNAMIYVFPTTMAVLTLFVATNGNVYGDYQNYGEHQLAGILNVQIHYDKEPKYYDKALLLTNGTEKKFDFGNYAEKFASPVVITFYYYQSVPEKSEVCLINLDSNRKNCEDTEHGDSKVDINMPD